MTACASKILETSYAMKSTISSYKWYLLAIPNEDFHVPPLNFQISFPFVPVQAHGAAGAINIFHAKDVLLIDKV